MTGITIETRGLNAALAAVSDKTARRIIVGGVNETGKTLRKGIPAALEQQLGARGIRSRTRAQAAFAGSTTPRYRLSLPKRVSVFQLKRKQFQTVRDANGHRRVKLSFRNFDKKLVFASVRREGKGKGKQRSVKLTAAGDKPERYMRGVTIPRTILDERSRFPGVASSLREAEAAAVTRMQAALQKAAKPRP